MCADTACAKGGKICHERMRRTQSDWKNEDMRKAKGIRKAFLFDSALSKLKYWVFQTK